MSYVYSELRSWLFTEEGSVAFMGVRDNVQEMLNKTGAFQMGKVADWKCPTNWHKMACVDRLVELKEIVELTDDDCMGQYRTFIKKGTGIERKET